MKVKQPALIPTYSEDGTLMTLVIDKFEGGTITLDDLIEYLRGYADMLEASRNDKAGLN